MLTLSDIKPFCFILFTSKEHSLFKKVINIQSAKLAKYGLVNFLKSISDSSVYIAIILNAISVRVLIFRPCIHLMQNLCALSKLNISDSVMLYQVSQPYRALGKTIHLHCWLGSFICGLFFSSLYI